MTEVGLLVGFVTYAALLGTKWVLMIGLVLFRTPVSRIPQSVPLWDDPQWAVTFSSLCLLFLLEVLANCRRAVL